LLKRITAVALCLLVLLCLIQTQRACRLSEEARDAKVKYEALRALTQEREKAALQYVAEMEDLILILQGNIDSLNTVIATKEDDITKLVGKAGKWEQAEAAIVDKDEMIANLRQQVSTWKSAFTLAREQSEAKDEIIFNLTEKYNVQVKISAEYKALWQGEKALRTNAELRIGVLEKQAGSLWSLDLGNKAVVLGLVALAVFGLVK